LSGADTFLREMPANGYPLAPYQPASKDISSSTKKKMTEAGSGNNSVGANATLSVQMVKFEKRERVLLKKGGVVTIEPEFFAVLIAGRPIFYKKWSAGKPPKTSLSEPEVCSYQPNGEGNIFGGKKPAVKHFVFIKHRLYDHGWLSFEELSFDTPKFSVHVIVWYTSMPLGSKGDSNSIDWG